MSREDFELFMLEQQKKFSEQQERLSEQQVKLHDDLAQLAEQTAKNEAQIRQNTENIAKLVDVVMSLTNVVQKHDDQLEELIERGKATDDRLDILINLFDRHLKESHQPINDPGVGQ